MDFRTRRQVTIALIAFGIVGGVAALAIWLNAPPPSCEDNRRNQGEEEVDCGGPCTPCTFRHQKPIEAVWTRFVQVRENSYDVAAELYNPNVKLGASAVRYEFKLFDASGVLVASRVGAGFIYPRETMHLTEIGLISGRTVTQATLELGRPEWLSTEAVRPDIIAGNRSYRIVTEDGIEKSTVEAIVTNRAIEDLRDIAVAVLLLDEKGNLLGAHRTVIASLASGASEAIKLTWPAVVAEAVASIVIEARSAADLADAVR